MNIHLLLSYWHWSSCAEYHRFVECGILWRWDCVDDWYTIHFSSMTQKSRSASWGNSWPYGHGDSCFQGQAPCTQCTFGWVQPPSFSASQHSHHLPFLATLSFSWQVEPLLQTGPCALSVDHSTTKGCQCHLLQYNDQLTDATELTIKGEGIFPTIGNCALLIVFTRKHLDVLQSSTS